MNVGCAGKTVRSLENACHTWAPWRCVHDKALYKSTFTLPYLIQNRSAEIVLLAHKNVISFVRIAGSVYGHIVESMCPHYVLCRNH